MRVAYQASSWLKSLLTFDLKPIEFNQDNIGLTNDYETILTYLGLFTLFLPIDLLREIVCETNRYARSLDNDGRP